MGGGDTHAARGRRLSQAAQAGRRDMSPRYLLEMRMADFEYFFSLSLDLIPFGQAAVAGLLPRKRMRMRLLLMLIPMARSRRGDEFKEYFCFQRLAASLFVTCCCLPWERIGEDALLTVHCGTVRI